MPRNGQATRDRLLLVAERLMTEQGYSATSVDQVIAEAGSSKGAFFHHFRSKSDLAAQTVARYAAADLAQLSAGLAAIAHLTDPAERVIAFLRYYEDGADELMTEQSGCLYATVLTERELTGPEITAEVARAVAIWRAELAALFRAALPAGAGLDPGALADHLYTTFEGGFILCRTTGDPSAMRAQLRVFRQLVAGLLGRGRPSR